MCTSPGFKDASLLLTFPYMLFPGVLAQTPAGISKEGGTGNLGKEEEKKAALKVGVSPQLKGQLGACRLR